MRTWVKVLLFTGIGIIVAGLIALFIAFAINGFSFRRTVLPGPIGERKPLKQMEKKIDEDFTSLEINDLSADIKLEKAEDGNCRVEYMDNEDGRYTIGVEDDTLVIKRLDTEDDWDWKRLDQILENVAKLAEQGFDGAATHVTVYLPGKVYDKLDIHVASGNIDIKEPFTFSEVELVAVSGNVKTSNLSGKESLNITATSGDIEAQDIQGFESMNIVTTSGNINVINAALTSQLNAASVSGDCKIERASGSGKISVETVSGKVSLIRTEFSEGDVETTSGELYLDYAKAEKMKMKTISGDISGKVEADTNVQGETSSGDLKYPSGTKGNWKFETVSGDVRLTN